MKPAVLLVCLMLVVAFEHVHGQAWDYARDFGRGAHDMWRAYR